jgi:23S rRNA (guanine1835-N2)-methyltransferase
MMEKLTFGDREFTLRRFPLREKESLRPWDAADEHLLKNLGEEPPSAGCRLLIFNDSFGALAVALNELRPQVWSDSFLAGRGLAHNLEANGLDPGSVPFVPADRTPSGPFDLVLLKLPKSLAHWEDTLLRLRPLLSEDARIITGGMIKHSPARAFELLESILGPTTTGLGWKKSRLAFTSFDGERSLPDRLADVVYTLEDAGLSLSNGPNVFSRDHLDLGTRYLLKHLPKTDKPLQVLDIGSGNGVLGLVLARQCPAARVLGIDESYQAVASARLNAANLGLTEDRVSFQVEGGLQELPAASYDLVVCNPPFHQAQVVGDQIAWGMFHQSRRVLKPGGRLMIVGNRHLGYHVKLQRLFGNCRVVASDRKFVVLEAVGQ